MSYLIVIDRRDFQLTLYRRWLFGRKWSAHRRYPIAVGMKGMETPAGMFEVQERSNHPDYQFPNSEWVSEELRGTIIDADDPDNPVAPRWIGISEDEGIGIHGTNRPESLGTRASHGCIRLLPRDVVELYRFARKRTPVFVY